MVGALALHKRPPTEAELIQAAADGKEFTNEQLDHIASPVGVPGDQPHTEAEGRSGFKSKEATASKAAAKKKSRQATPKATAKKQR
jgi:hypothetical protein